MPDSFTRGGKIRKPQTGAYEDTWGAVQNADVFELFDDLITGLQEITLSGTTYSMPVMTQGGDSDSRAMMLRFIGSPSGAVTVTLPATVNQKLYAIDNQCGQDIILTYGSGDTSTIGNGLRRFVMCDGVDVLNFDSGADADSLGGIEASKFARRDVSNVFVGSQSSAWITVAEAPTTTINAAAGNHQRLTLTGNRAIAAPSSPVDGQEMFLQVVQDGTGGRTLTWDSSFLHEGGVAPTLATTANARDLFLMVYDAAAAQWLVGQFGSIAGSGSVGLNYTVSGGGVDFSLAALLGTLGSAVTVNLTIAQGTILQAGSTGSFAFDCANALPSGSTLNIVNNGYILGKGGAGGGGAGSTVNGSGNHGHTSAATDGQPGGGAFRGPGAGVTCNLTNNGYIWGGGGGGGGGGAATFANGGQAGGGGGGGGAGGGLGGYAGGANSVRGTNGASGSSGALGAGGAAGAGNSSGGATGVAGGAGGDWGTAGTAGGSGVASDGAAGAAGKAVELNGGAVTIGVGAGAPNIKGAVS